MPWREVGPGAEEANGSLALPGAAMKDGEDAEQSDDGGSTAAPSSAATASHLTTPETGPSLPPADIEEPTSSEPLEQQLGEVLFEVFGNGQRHAIGTEDDPDDMEPDDGPRLAVPLRVLQLLAADARRRRRTRQDLRREGEEEDEEGHGNDLTGEEGVAGEDDGIEGIEEGAEEARRRWRRRRRARGSSGNRRVETHRFVVGNVEEMLLEPSILPQEMVLEPNVGSNENRNEVSHVPEHEGTAQEDQDAEMVDAEESATEFDGDGAGSDVTVP